MENSVVPSNKMEANQPANHECDEGHNNEMEANQPANPESGEGHNQHEEAGTERVISIRDSLEERFRRLIDSDASAEEEDKEYKPLIGQVPMFLRKKTELEKYFKPSIVSIGPLHEQGQQFKLQLAKLFIEKKREKKEIIYNILKDIKSFKECYDQQELLKKFHGNDEDLAWMFFVDGCALIQLVRCLFGDEFCEIADDQMDLLTSDLLLLDNQLPMGVLNLVMGFSKEGEELYQNDHPVGKQSKEFRQSIYQFIEIIKMITFKRWEKVVKADSVSFNNANHLLRLLWMNLVEKETYYRSYKTKTTPRQFRSVKDLQAAGIILEPNNSSSSLRDISFNRGIFFCKLKIPSFLVDEQGKFLVFNLIAFEMHPNFDKDRVVTSYISFLNSLIATKEDVAELRKAGILFNYLPNDEEVLKTFRELTSSLKPYPDILSGTKEELIDYFNDKKSMTTGKWLSEAMHVYFRSPWTTIGFVSATFLLILTIIQTVFSVLAYAQHI